MLGMLALATALLPANAEEVPAAPAATEPGVALSPRARLDDAIGTYLAGEALLARDKLRAVLALGPELPPDVRLTALAYLGDILYSEEGPASAREIFETLLGEAPAYPMDPFEHPPEVCRYFEEVRVSLRAPTPPTPRDREAYPWLVLAPGGTYYFSKGRVAPGVVFGGLQVAGAVVSIGTFITITDAFEGGVQARDPEYYNRLIAINRTAATVGWLAWTVPVVLESAAFDRRGQVVVALGPRALTVGGSF